MGFEPTSLLRDYLISSQGRYDHFDTCPYTIFILPASLEKCKKLGKIARAGQKSDSTKSPKFCAFFKNETARFVTEPRPFRVRAVMTTSIPVHIQRVLRYYKGNVRKNQGPFLPPRRVILFAGQYIFRKFIYIKLLTK